MVGYTLDDLTQALAQMEAGLKTGEAARLELHTYELPGPEALAEFHSAAVQAGFHISYPQALMVQGVPTIVLNITKGSPLLPLLIGILPTLLVGGLVAYSINQIKSISSALVPILLLTLGGVVVVALVLRKPATAYIERGGKIPMLPAATRKASGKPSRYDVDVDIWEERDRLSIAATDKRTNKTIAEWWDDDARQMFEDGFFKRQPKLKESVLDYLEEMGKLAPGYYPKALAARGR